MKAFLFLCSILFWIVPGRLSIFQERSFFIGLSDLAWIGIVFFIFFIVPFKKTAPRYVKGLAVILVCLAVLKSILGMFWSPTGLIAKYYANPSWTGKHEVAWAYKRIQAQATRIDPKIDFRSYGYSPFQQTFPLYFANDTHRFNWHGNPREVERRRYFSFSAEWEGRVRIHPDDPNIGVLVANDMAEVELDGKTIGISTENEPLYFTLESGTYPIKIKYKYDSRQEKRLLLGWQVGPHTIEAVPSSRFLPGPTPTSYNTLLAGLNWVLHVIWCLVVGWIAVRVIAFPLRKEISKERLTLFILAVLMCLGFFLDTLSTGRKPYAQILSGGNDYLTYETFAQNILGGDLFDRRDTGDGPFYYQSVYRYFLAAFHLILGEDPLMVTFGQEIVMVCILIFLYYTGKHVFSRRVGGITLFVAIACGQLIKFPQRLLDTTFSTGFSLLTLYCLMRYGRRAEFRFCLLTGLFLGVACALRSNLILFVPVALAWIIWKSPPSITQKAIRAVLFGVIVISPLFWVGIRNYHVTGAFAMMPSSGPINIWLGNHPPEQDDILPEKPIPEVIDYMTSDPKAFAKGILVKVAYVFGIQLPKQKFKAGIFIPAMVALIGFIYLVRTRAPRKNEDLFLLFSWIVINAAVLIAIFPWSYGGRLMAPMYPAMYLLSAIFGDHLLDAFQKRRRNTLPESL